MGGAYIEMLPPDRPIHMIGQPIIKLVPSGGPGGDLGDLGVQGRRRRPRRLPPPPSPVYAGPAYYPPSGYYAPQILEVVPISQDDSDFGPDMGQYNTALQQELTAVAEGNAPDVSAEYFRPKELPGLPSTSEGPHTSRQGVYPKKLRDMVVYDAMSGQSPFISFSDIAAATPMPNFGGSLGCCGADGMGEPWSGGPEKGTWNHMSGYGMPYFDTGMSDDAAADAAKLLKGRCEGLEAKAKEIVAAVAKASADSSLTDDQRKKVALAAKTSLKALRDEWRACRQRLKQIISRFKKKGSLSELGLSGLADKVEQEDKLARCKARIRSLRKACKKQS